jgi:hypothetical protein
MAGHLFRDIVDQWKSTSNRAVVVLYGSMAILRNGSMWRNRMGPLRVLLQTYLEVGLHAISCRLAVICTYMIPTLLRTPSYA